ncbi:MAG: tetratricopeptide repeat protein [Betaproteobacteria bacterium]
MPTITASKSMTAWSLRLAALLLLCVACGAQAAESPITINDLTLRADAGDRTAMRALAEAYYAGQDGAEQDFTKAADWYRRLAKAGDARAQTSLGLMYARGYGVEKNLAEAHRWWNFAAVQNDPGAQYNLGLTYIRGEGVAADPARAARWFREAARRGHVQAQYNLGLLLHEGKGVARQPQEAYYWIKVAALQGDDRAEQSLAPLGAALSEAQRRDADRQAGEWMKSLQKTTP